MELTSAYSFWQKNGYVKDKKYIHYDYSHLQSLDPLLAFLARSKIPVTEDGTIGSIPTQKDVETYISLYKQNIYEDMKGKRYVGDWTDAEGVVHKNDTLRFSFDPTGSYVLLSIVNYKKDELSPLLSYVATVYPHVLTYETPYELRW
jgi:hypothetical protein